MSNTPGSTPTPPASTSTAGTTTTPNTLASNTTGSGNREIKLISRSNLFYWWPVWFFGLVFAIITLLEGNRLVVIPSTGKVKYSQKQSEKDRFQTAFDLSYTIDQKQERDKDAVDQPLSDASNVYHARISNKAWMGSIFVVILLLTMVITNVPLRGLWSFMVIILIIVVALLITVFHVWEELFELIGGLKIYINMAGYLFISGFTLFIWSISFFFFDRRAYIVFTPGQVKVCEHVGDSVRTFDTVGMTFEKQRDDLFRHYILGFGSGDLIVRTAGAERQEIKIQNVLNIGWRLKEVENMIRERATVSA